MTFRRTLALLTPLFLLVVTACAEPEPAGDGEAAPEAADTTAQETAEPGLVDVIAVDYAFQTPTELPSGWTTFRMANEGEEPHFMTLWKLPEGKTIDDYGAEVVPAFVAGYDSLMAGTADQGRAMEIIGAILPDWFADVVPSGGPGLVTAGRVAETTVRLAPGRYVMECYAKTADGRFHGELGMVTELVVTDEPNGASPPEAGTTMTLSNTEIGVEGPLPAGEHTFAVEYAEHPPGLGNDVHVARLGDDTDLDELAAWMDWMNEDGLTPPAPAEFVGGAQERPVGDTSYFTVELEPGRYAWISEATTADRPVREFTVE